MRWFRAITVASAAGTLWLTWELWAVRSVPPMLPAVALPTIATNVLLLTALGMSLVAPRTGVGVFGVVLLYSMAIDQVRIQPQFVSFTLLLVGTLDSHQSRLIGRVHLISLWAWAGLNKLLSKDFLTHTGPNLVATLIPAAPSWLHHSGAYGIALTEVSLAALAIVPKTRRIAAALALALHAGIVLHLSPLGRNWNQAVWCWNVTLAVAGFALIGKWTDGPSQAFRSSHPGIKLLVAVMLIAPFGFQFGLVDAYLSHNLYSSNVPRPSRMQPTLTLFNVPFPPEHRLFEQEFRLTCNPGDVLVIEDSRWWFVSRGLARRQLEC
jgi:hypothetical protein